MEQMLELIFPDPEANRDKSRFMPECGSMGVIAEALMMQLRALVYPLLLTNKDTLRFRFSSLGLKCVSHCIYLMLPKVCLCNSACWGAMFPRCPVGA